MNLKKSYREIGKKVAILAPPPLGLEGLNAK